MHTFSTTRQGYRQMLTWMRSLGELQRAGVELTGSYGARVTPSSTPSAPSSAAFPGRCFSLITERQCEIYAASPLEQKGLPAANM